MNYFNGPFSDERYADQLKEDLKRTCFDDCLKRGIRWSVVYELNAVLMILLTIQAAVQLVGVWHLRTKVCAVCTGCSLCCFQLVVIIITGVYRFNTKGTLAALSQTGSMYKAESPPAGAEFLSTERNYAIDASWITSIWVLQLCCFCCCQPFRTTTFPTIAEAKRYNLYAPVRQRDERDQGDSDMEEASAKSMIDAPRSFVQEKSRSQRSQQKSERSNPSRRF